jgi:hypothetical protein
MALAHVHGALQQGGKLAEDITPTLACALPCAPCHYPQVPYNAWLWAVRTVVNCFVVLGVSTAVMWLFALSLNDWGGDVIRVVRVVHHC